MATPKQHNKLRDSLLARAERGAQWYAVIDAATDETLPARARDGGLQVRSLYTGQLGALAAPAAPFLIALSFQSGFADWLFTHWGRNYGILLQARVSFDEAWKHFRSFLLVKDEAGKKYRFRFYDPRVLRAFLPSCSPQEAEGFFGPTVSYYAAGRSGTSLLEFRPSAEGCSIREVPVTLTPASDLESDDLQAKDDDGRVADLRLVLRDNKNEQPIAGANCYCVGPECRDVVTNADGCATISAMTVGDYRVMVRHEDGRSGVGNVALTRDGAEVTVVCSNVS